MEGLAFGVYIFGSQPRHFLRPEGGGGLAGPNMPGLRGVNFSDMLDQIAHLSTL